MLAHAREVGDRGRAAHEEWEGGYEAWRTANADAGRPCSTG